MLDVLHSTKTKGDEEEGGVQGLLAKRRSTSLQSTFADSDSLDEEHNEHTDEVVAEKDTAELFTQQHDDPMLFQHVETLYQEEKLLEAARLLRTLLSNNAAIQPSELQQQILTLAHEMEEAIADIVGPPNEEWNRESSTSNGHRPTVIYTKFDEQWKLTCRIETPIEASLMVPLLSVLNETDLYDTWIPSWRFPKIGVSQSNKLHHSGKANQLLQIVCDVPWPLRTREVIVQATAVDEIDERGYIVIRLNTLDEEHHHPAVHEKDPEVVRVEFEGAILFRACPLDHELRKNMDQKSSSSQEPIVLVSFKMFLDSKFTAIPTSLVNFCTKTVIGSMWHMFLNVAEDVREGTRPEHAKVIAEKADLYQWIERRSQVMLDQLLE